jgi:hypothetical protein
MPTPAGTLIERLASKLISKEDARQTRHRARSALRALSVVAVVGFHFQIPGFAGGSVGVDVFLVITGYLMTGKVLTDLALGAVIAGWFVTPIPEAPATGTVCADIRIEFCVR